MDVSGTGANVSALAVPQYAGPPRQIIAGGEVQAEVSRHCSLEYVQSD